MIDIATMGAVRCRSSIKRIIFCFVSRRLSPRDRATNRAAVVPAAPSVAGPVRSESPLCHAFRALNSAIKVTSSSIIELIVRAVICALLSSVGQ